MSPTIIIMFAYWKQRTNSQTKVCLMLLYQITRSLAMSIASNVPRPAIKQALQLSVYNLFSRSGLDKADAELTSGFEAITSSNRIE